MTKIYVTIKGEKQSDIKGSSTEPNYKDKIVALARSHKMEVISDGNTGATKGQTRYSVYTFDTSDTTPLLMNSFQTREALDVKVEFANVDGNGNLATTYTESLVKARVVSIEKLTQEVAPFSPFTRYSFSYEKISDKNVTQEAETELHNATVFTAAPAA